ncbi:MAG: hypothetical protein K2I82_06175 [Ruminococcus sp.]|nr:hypothetical protein [Ruminococcus sp.]
MKSYDDITERVFRRGNEILRKRQKRTAVIKRSSLAVSGMCAAVLVCFGIWRDNNIKNSINDFHDKVHIITENDNVPKTTTECSQQTVLSKISTTSVNVTNIPLLSATTTPVATSEKKEFSENTVIFTTILNPVYSANSIKAQTELTETKTESLHETTQTILSTAFQTNSMETNTGFPTQTTTITSENTDEEGGIYMKKLTSFFTSAVVLAASATPIVGHAEYNIGTSRYWKGEKAMFAKMDSGELETDIDGNGVVDALDGYLLKCYCYNENLGLNISDDISSRIENIADYNGDGEVNNDDVTSWVRHFIVDRNLKVELFDYDYYVSEYVPDDTEYISYVKSWFVSALYSNMEYLRAGYDVVTDMYKNGILDLDMNKNGQLDIGDLTELYIHRYDENDAFKTYCSTISNSPSATVIISPDNFFYYTTLCIVANIELKPEYFTEEYYVETYDIIEYDAGVLSSRVKQAAGALGIKPDEDAWLKFNTDDLYSFFDSYCNDVENGLRPAPDVNMDGVVDFYDYIASNIYFEDLIYDRTADDSILPADIWNNLEENCDFNGNGTSKDIYDILTVQLYVIKYADEIYSFGEAYDKYVESLGGTSETVVSEISYENNVEILASFEMKRNAVYGDANEDGFVDIADATAIVQHMGNPDEYALSKQGEINADIVNQGDGVTGVDAMALNFIESKKIQQSELPITMEQYNALLDE